LRQFSYLIGKHGKSTPLLCGTRRFIGGIQGRLIGLLGDFLDH